MEKQLEVGLHFCPSDEELLFLLKKRTEGEGRPSNFVMDRELYGRNAVPWEIFKDNDSWEEDAFDRKKRVLHVFTKLSHLSGKRVSRTAGCGTWEGQTKGKEIYGNNGKKRYLLGTKKTFTFGVKKGSKSEVVGGNWTMYEYSLANVKSDYVICKIIKSKFNKGGFNDECENQESSRPSKRLKSQAADYGCKALSNSVQEYACSSSNGDQEYYQAGDSLAYFSSDAADQGYCQGSSFGGDFIMSGRWNSQSEESLAIQTANWDLNPMANYSKEPENVEMQSHRDSCTSMVNQENLELPNNFNDTSSLFIEEMWSAVNIGEEFQFAIDDKEDFIPNSFSVMDSSMEGYDYEGYHVIA